MDVQKIDIIRVETFERFLHGIRILVLAGPEFCGKEDFFPGNAAALHAASDRTLVDVRVCRIDHTIPHLQRFADAVFRVPGRKHKRADADDRAGGSVIQNHLFHGKTSFYSFCSLGSKYLMTFAGTPPTTA